MSDANKAGALLAESKREETRLAENISPDDPSEQIVVGVTERVRLVRNRLTVYKNVASEGAIMFDRLE